MTRFLFRVLASLGGVGLALWLALPLTAQPQNTPVSVQSIAAGDTNIGNVDIVTSALPTGASTEATLGGVLTSVQSIATSAGLLDDAVLAEDAVHGSGASGRLALAVRNDAGTAFAADGDYVPLSVDSAGAVRVTGGGGGTQYTEADTDATITGTALLWEDAADTLRVTSAAKPLPVSCGDCSGTGVSHVDDAAFTVTTDDVVPAAGVFDDAATDSVDENDAGALRMSANRNLYIHIRDAAGNERGVNVNASNQLAVAGPVTNAGTFVVQVDGAALTSLQLTDNIVQTEDTASGNLDPGVVFLARQTLTPANTAGTDGDYEALQVSAGRLWTSTTVTNTVTIDSELPAAAALADNTSNPTTSGIAAYIMCYDGSTWDRCFQSTITEATQDGALTVASTIGNISFARASSTEPTNVTANDDAVMLWALPSGALATTLRDSAGVDITDTTNTALRVNIVAGAAAGGTSMTDDAAFTVATSAFTPIGGTYRSVRDPVTDNDGGALAMTINRGLLVSMETPLGDSVMNDTLDTLMVSQATAANLNATVVGTGTFAVQVSSLPASTNTIEVVGDAAHDAAVAGNPVLLGATSSAAAPTDVTADSEAVRLWALRNGALAIQPTFSGTLAAVNNGAVSGGTLRVTVANDSTGILAAVGTVSTVTTLSQLGGVALPVEDVAETAAGVGIYAMGVRRDTAASSAGTAGDNTMASYDSLGRIWTRNGNPCGDHARLTTVAISTSSAGNVELVALNASDLIYVCGYSVVAGAATGVQLIYGTGTACATGETDMTGVWSFAANGGITQANQGAPQFIVPAGNAFCVENSGANAIAGHVTYVRTATP